MDENKCPFCGEIAEPTLLHSEYELANEGGNQTIGCPICKCQIVDTEAWRYSACVNSVEKLIKSLVSHGMKVDKLISCTRRIKDLEGVETYFTGINDLF